MIRSENFGAPVAGELIELRVHGVGGTTPETLLGAPITELVGGDVTAGFFRVPAWIPIGDPPRGMEGYSWGGMTSRARARALWLLLLPFALVNLAGWMFRHRGEADQRKARTRDSLENLALAAIRLFGLVVTVAVWVFVGVVAVDLVGYQCGIRTSCASQHWWMWLWDLPWVSEEPARGLAVAGGLGFLSVLAVSYLARRSQRHTHFGERLGKRFDDRFDPAWRISLRWRTTWLSPHVAHRLGLIHTSAALAMIGLILSLVLEETAGPGMRPWFSTAFVMLLLGSAVATFRLEGVSSRWHQVLFALTSGLVLALEGWALFMTSVVAGDGQAPLALLPATWIYFASTFLIILLAVLHFLLWRREPKESRTDRVRLLVPVALLLAALGPINAVGSGLLIRVADLLGDAVPESQLPLVASTQPPIIYSDVVGGVAVVTVFAIVVFGAVIWAGWLRAKKLAPSFDQLSERYQAVGGLDPNSATDSIWAQRVGHAEALAAITDQAAFVVAVTGVVVGVIGGVVSIVSRFGGSAASALLLPAFHEPASYFIGLLPLGAIFLINRIYRSPDLRRGVGTIWDVATFWPRWFHPWAPPSYGEQAVPQLRRRLGWLAGRGPVILSAHSQGTVIAVAALANMLGPSARRPLENVSVLTHGAPLRRLYARYFPEYFDQELFRSIHAALGRASTTTWFNLHRRTDFIGGSVFDSGFEGVEDILVLDPETPRSEIPGELPPRIRGHSNYYHQTKYGQIITDIAAQIHE